MKKEEEKLKVFAMRLLLRFLVVAILFRWEISFGLETNSYLVLLVDVAIGISFSNKNSLVT